eukprot:m.99091 g.99091  ORF g.99091 m.99091 type:complete len:240 (-) comp14889_c3_seq1:202-921(-)
MSAAELAASKQQLAQVEAALLTAPGDESLITLANNLREIIALQTQLVTATDKTADGTQQKSYGGWNVGDTCEAVWSEDGNYYKAEIVKFEDDTQVRVRYIEYGDEDVVKINSLRRPHSEDGTPGSTEHDTAAQGGDAPVSAKTKPSRDIEREQRRKKAKRKKEKETEELQVLETQKNKWMSFAHKGKKGLGSGKHGKSIFASPEDPSGKVGVGTCGIGGRGMTDFQNRGKWKFDATQEN